MHLCNPAEPHRWNAQGEISNDLTLSRQPLIALSKNQRYKRPQLFTIECRLTVGQPNRMPFSSFNFPLCVRGVLKPRAGPAAELYFSLSLPLCEPGWRP